MVADIFSNGRVQPTEEHDHGKPGRLGQPIWIPSGATRIRESVHRHPSYSPVFRTYGGPLPITAIDPLEPFGFRGRTAGMRCTAAVRRGNVISMGTGVPAAATLSQRRRSHRAQGAPTGAMPPARWMRCSRKPPQRVWRQCRTVSPAPRSLAGHAAESTTD